ncbi:hypothetical protein ACWEO2_22485 [Nocardia sp. NPDC004278]
MSSWTLFGLTVAVGLPLAVILGTVFWPTQIPKDKSVDGIRQRIEDEDSDRGRGPS